MIYERLFDDLSNSQSGIQRRIWILEYHLYVASVFSHFTWLEAENVGFTITCPEIYLAFHCNIRRAEMKNIDNGFSKCGFAASGFTYESKCFTLLYLKRYFLHGFYLANFSQENTARNGKGY